MDVHNRDYITKLHVSGTSLKLMPHTIQDIPSVCLLMYTNVLCIFETNSESSSLLPQHALSTQSDVALVMSYV